MNEDIIELANAVYSIEEDICKSSGVDYYNLNLVTNGFASFIEFLGIQIWSSENDLREYIDETDAYEPIEPFLRRTIMGELEDLRKIKL